MNAFARFLVLLVVLPWLTLDARAQFIDTFDQPKTDGWFTLTGDGSAVMAFAPHNGFARMAVDATQDQTNVWWAIIKRDVTAHLDLTKLQDPAYELRVEARVRPSHTPRRVNFMLNTQRTTDYHEHLREYDLADAGGWHVISFTTRNFQVAPGDTVFVQLGVTDWGPERYHLDVDYYRADVVRRDAIGADLGEPLIYHPEVPPLTTFRHQRPVAHDSVINAEFPDVNFNDWGIAEGATRVPVLTVAATQWAVLRWDFASDRYPTADGAGVLELTTHSVPQGGRYIAHYGEDLGMEFGKIRISEILAGDPLWEQDAVTYRSLLRGGKATDVFNTQMIFDVELAQERGGKTYVTLPRPVMQRLLTGQTKGLVIRPLGALMPSVYASEAGNDRGPRLYFNTTR